MVKYRAKALITKLNKLITVLTVLALSLTIAAPAAYADSGSDTETKTVKIGYYENEVFEEGARDDVPKKGYAYEYYQKLSEYTGWKYEYVYGSFSVLYQKLIDGKIDMLAGLAKKEEREGIIGYPDAPMGSETYNLIKHVNDNKVTADPSTMNGRKIGVLESAVADSLKKYLDEHKITADVKVYSDNKDMFEDFDKDVIDVLAVEGDGAYGRNNVEVLCSFGASDYYLCVDINNKKLLKELNTAQMMLDAEEPNYITSLRAKFYPISVASRAMSDDEKKWIKNNDSITFGYLKGYLPYCDEDSKGNVTGMLKEYVPEMFEQLGLSDINVKYKSYSNYDDMINSVTSGETDAVFPVGGGMYFAEKSGIYQSTHVLSSSTDLVYMGEYSDEITTDFAVNENNRMQYYYVKNHYPDAKIASVDSLNASMGEGQVAIKAAKLRDEGLSFEEVVAQTEAARNKVNQFVTVHNLNALKAAGRVTGSSAFFGNLLGVKPIIISDSVGNNVPIKKVKGRFNSLEEIVNLTADAIEDENQDILVAHADCLEEAEEVVQMLKEKLPKANIILGYIGPIIGASIGADAIAIFSWGKDVSRFDQA